jgi:hypothetical protein
LEGVWAVNNYCYYSYFGLKVAGKSRHLGSSKLRIVESAATLAGFIGFDVGAAAVV